MSSYPQEWKNRLIGIALAEEGKRDNAKFALMTDAKVKSKKTIERWLAELQREAVRQMVERETAPEPQQVAPTIATTTGHATGSAARFAKFKRDYRILQLREEWLKALNSGDEEWQLRVFNELDALDPTPVAGMGMQYLLPPDTKK